MQAATRRQHAFALQRHQQLCTVCCAFNDLPIARLVVGKQVPLVAQVDVQALPESGQGGQIMRCNRGHGIGRILLRRLQPAVITPLEIQ